MTSPAAGTDADTTLGADTTMGSVSGGDTEIYPDGYPGFGPEVLPAELTYHTRDEAYKAINASAAAHGYAFITSRSFQTSSGLTTALYMCDRGGRAADPNRVLKRQRAASRRIGCNFSVYVKERRDGTWQLKHRAGPQFSQHNHAPSTDIFAHRVHRALDADQKDSIDVLLQMDLKLKQIVTFLRLKYRKVINGRDVSNYIASARRQRELGGEGGVGEGGSGEGGVSGGSAHDDASNGHGQSLGAAMVPPASAGSSTIRAPVPAPAPAPTPAGHSMHGMPGPMGAHPAGMLQHQQRLPPPQQQHHGMPHGRGAGQYRPQVHGPSVDQVKEEDLLLEEELREQLGKELNQSASHDYFAPH